MFDLSMDLTGNGGFGASPAWSSVWCSPAGGVSFAEKSMGPEQCRNESKSNHPTSGAGAG